MTATAAPALAQDPSEWEIDAAHSAAHFRVKHLMVSTVRGTFRRLSGSVLLDERDLTRSRVNFEMEAASIDTGEPRRDEHLRSPDFFDVAKFPKVTFRSTRIERNGDGFRVTGDLSMHGVTRPVTLAVESLSAPTKSPYGKIVRGVSAFGKLDRRDWGLTWNGALEAGGVLVGDEVKLEIDAELLAKTPG